jgi:hypothetical protein
MPDSDDAKAQTAKNTVAFALAEDPNYRVVAANGVWGGVTPRGKFLVNFFVESNTTPSRIVHEVTADGRLGREIEREGVEIGITRTLQVGVLMSIEEAESIADWMKRRVTEYRSRGEKS